MLKLSKGCKQNILEGGGTQGNPLLLRHLPMLLGFIPTPPTGLGAPGGQGVFPAPEVQLSWWIQ